jgi:sugar phosphate isomerase/epimerase
MLALSTSWKSKESKNGEILVQALEGFDVSGIELDYRINEAIFRQMKKPLKRSDLKVVSIHNFFPIPAVIPHSKGGGDLFLLSHPDREERRRAIQWTIKSIEHANDFEAKAVVLHCGYVEMNTEIDVLYDFLETERIHSEEAQAFIIQKLKECDLLKTKHLEGLLFSLDRIIRVAEKQNITLGIENRYHYHELPGFDDFEVLFTEFEGGPVGYWHDTGHAFANEVLTIIPSAALLKTYSDKLIGVHLHDAVGLDDHLAPGTGKIDFKSLKSFLKNDTLLVVELKPGTPDSEVSQGIQFIRDNVMN